MAKTNFLSSSVGRKYFMAVSGLALVGFLILHLAGNLLLLQPGGSLFNEYAHGLSRNKVIYYGGEVVLFLLFTSHAAMATMLSLQARAARPEGYRARRATKGGHSRWGFGSTRMLLTGLILLAFLILHVIQFRLGANEADGYVTQLGSGQEARDLYRLVAETFANPLWVGVYVVVLLFSFFHFRHGFWSAFQSLGAMNPRYDRLITGAGVLIAAVAVAGFILLPVYLHFFGGAV